MSNNNCSSKRSSLVNSDRPDSATNSSRTCSSVAFFHDSVTTSEIDLRFTMMDPQRRARAIATAPRRKRYDDDDDDDDDEKRDNEQKTNRFGFVKTPAVLIPQQSMMEQTQSLPQTQSGISLIPSFRVDPPAREDSDELDYLYNINSRRNRCLSGPLP
ncbi:unnamed protein product [Adineta steineri]|uniref:Uncharacterized protein n=1 Tax=Adineta steineri TaxID=433720 RepID=A0A818QEL0_9BILA|nr:unnamed protein product [Adineta steineri]CAF1261968.1 unnamed protein product [Adineta steineri]CAF1286571.1 unnamed protein product [Adineta steineri]CAF3635360.1 unnamed protein product [Adineta steineri]CAF3680814.1 unnamed protein product [Adineta steineri]